jgi:hypothetical protein
MAMLVITRWYILVDWLRTRHLYYLMCGFLGIMITHSRKINQLYITTIKGVFSMAQLRFVSCVKNPTCFRLSTVCWG